MTRTRTAPRPVPPGDAPIRGGSGRTRQDRNRMDALAAGYEQLETSGTLDNFRIAAGTSTRSEERRVGKECGARGSGERGKRKGGEGRRGRMERWHGRGSR